MTTALYKDAAEPFAEAIDIIKEEGGEALKACYQCGLCSATCPWTLVKNFIVRRIMHQSQLGVVDFEDEDEFGHKVTRTVTTRPNLIEQIIETDFELQWIDKGKTKKEHWTFPLRFFFRYELEHLVERSLFESYGIFGDFHDGQLTRDSKEFVVVCRKNKA